ncbi:MAG: hypothetical protein JNK19_11420 [Tabrizicola sp.]|nr:hypothetical protein [Tabrizicola sp.]
MSATPRSFASFDAAFAMAFAEEVSGETFFAALAETEPDPRRAGLWAKVALIEKRTIAALRPLAETMGLAPADEAAVRLSGRDEAAEWQALPFAEVMAIMIRDYPTGYLAEFEAMLPIAPPKAKAAVQLLIDHEIAIIDMARAELSGTSDPAAPLDAYLAHVAGWTWASPD